jgi:putative transposase
MPNHYHLVVETQNGDLSAGMQHLNGTYGRWFNDAYELSGHVFQGRFHCVQVETTGHLLELARYVLLNPVRAGLCSAPDAWPWSSYRAAVGLERAPAFLGLDRFLSEFSAERDRARDRLRAFVEDTSWLPR